MMAPPMLSRPPRMTIACQPMENHVRQNTSTPSAVPVLPTVIVSSGNPDASTAAMTRVPSGASSIATGGELVGLTIVPRVTDAGGADVTIYGEKAGALGDNRRRG